MSNGPPSTSDTPIEKDRPSGAALAVSVIWIVALVAAYAAQHVEILGIPHSIANLAKPRSANPAFGQALWVNIHALATALSVMLACYGYGSLATWWLPRGALFGSIPTETARFCVGTGIGSLLVFTAGHCGLLTFAVASAISTVGLGALALHLHLSGVRISLRSRPLASSSFDGPAGLMFALLGIVGLLVLVTALAPPTARDALTYHLAVPAQYIEHNGIVEIPQNIYSYLPFGMEMLFTWAMLLGPDTSPNLIHAGFWLACVLVVYSTAKHWTGSTRWGAGAALLFASVPSVIWNAGIAHNEMSMCLYFTIAVLALGRWFATMDHPLLLVAGLCLGLAASHKHTLLTMAPAFALAVLLRIARADSATQRSVLVKSLGIGVISGIFALPYYVQNAVRTGNPLFPFFWNLFPTHSAFWDGTRAELFDQFLRKTYGTTSSLVDYLILPYSVSIEAADDVPRSFDGVLGPAFLVAIPILVHALVRQRDKLRPEWLVATLVCGLTLIAWAFQSQQLRFLLPSLPLLAIVSVAALRHVESRVVGWAYVAGLSAAVALNVLVASASIFAANPMAGAIGLETRDDYLHRRLKYYGLYKIISDTTPANARILLVDMRNDTYHLRRSAYCDSIFEDYTVGRIVAGARSGAEVAQGVRALGVTHVLVREDILLDQRLSPFETNEAAGRWVDFLRTETIPVARSEAIALYALRP